MFLCSYSIRLLFYDLSPGTIDAAISNLEKNIMYPFHKYLAFVPTGTWSYFYTIPVTRPVIFYIGGELVPDRVLVLLADGTIFWGVKSKMAT